MDLLTQVTQDYVPIATETMQGMVDSRSKKKKLILLTVPTSITAADLNNATIRDGRLITEKSSFVCNVFASDGSCTAPTHDSENGITKFSPPDHCLQVLQPLDAMVVGGSSSRKRKFISTKPPPSFPTGLKVRYKPFGSGKPEDPLPPVLLPVVSDDDVVDPDDVTMEVEPPVKMHKKHKKEKKKSSKEKKKSSKEKKEKKKKKHKKDKKSKNN